MLHQELSEKGGQIIHKTGVSEEIIAKRIATRRNRESWGEMKRWKEAGWKAEQIALLGTMADEDVAAKIGRSATAVRVMRTRLKIPTFKDRRVNTGRFRTRH